MRILHVLATLDPQSGGPAQACLEMARCVAQRGHQVSVFATDYSATGPDGQTIDLTRFSDIEIRLFRVQSPRAWKRSMALYRALQAELSWFDVVDIHSLYLFHNWATAHLCRRADVPFIIRPHGLLDPYIHRRHRWRKLVTELAFQNAALRSAAAIHYTAELEREISTPFACGGKPAVIPLGIDAPARDAVPSRDALRRLFPDLAGRTVMLFLGRIHPKKGLDLLIPAMAQARRNDPTLHLLLAGPDGGALGPTLALAERFGLTRHLTVAGMLSGDAKAAAFAGSDFFVLPSYSENFGIAVGEAMAYALPVVISDRVNIHPAISAAGAGAVVPCATAPLAAALAQMSDPARRAEMGARARALVERDYAWPVIGQQLEDLYVSVLRHPGGASAATPQGRAAGLAHRAST